jgi:Leucine-rich repeat (LRR) protein
MFLFRTDQAKRRNRFVRFSLRTALILLTLLCLALGWWVVTAERQRDAVAAVRELGGRVRYTYELGPEGFPLKKPEPPWAPEWLRDTFGEDLFITLHSVEFEGIRDDFVVQVVPKLRRVASLHTLGLRDTLISDAALANIAELTQLEHLYIGTGSEAPGITTITDKGLAQLSTLRRLRGLTVNNCSIDGSALVHLGMLRRLEWLYMRHTNFNDAAAHHLRQFPRLHRLDLWNTSITDAAIDDICELDRLEDLYLPDNRLTDAAAPKLAKLTRLKVLDVSETQFSDHGVEQLQSLTQLRELAISNTQIDNPKIDRFRKLQDLVLAETRISDTVLKQASQLPELRSLDLFECEQVTDAGIKYLEMSESLQFLDPPNTQAISNGALQNLRRAKPKLVID